MRRAVLSSVLMQAVLAWDLVAYVTSFTPMRRLLAALEYGPRVQVFTPDNILSDIDDGTCVDCTEETGGLLTLVDFYAPWCGHCQRVAPRWTKASEDFKAFGRVTFGVLDCVANGKTCTDFKVTGYPTLCAFISLPGGTKRVDYTCEERHSGEMDSDGITEWVNKRIETAKIKKSETKCSTISDSQTTAWCTGHDYTGELLPDGVCGGKVCGITDRVHCCKGSGNTTDSSTVVTKSLVPQVPITKNDLAATAFYGLKHSVFIGVDTLTAGEAKATQLAGWLTLLKDRLVADPDDDEDFNGLITTLETTGQEWTEAQWDMSIQRFTLFDQYSPMDCGGDECSTEPGDYFEVCRGTFHGYACGLWQMFHALTVSATDATARSTLEAVRAYVATFFGCLPCQQHFAEVAKDLTSITTKREGVMWLWRTHNGVSQRLAPEWNHTTEEVLYPSVTTCPKCRSAEEGATDIWDEDAVYAYLLETYKAPGLRTTAGDITTSSESKTATPIAGETSGKKDTSGSCHTVTKPSSLFSKILPFASADRKSVV